MLLKEQEEQQRKLMKNKNIIFLIKNLLLCLPILLASTVVCYAEPVVMGSGVIPIKTVFIKFGITMGAVLASLLIIWFALSTFKKFKATSVKEYKEQSLYGDNFKTSTNINEAIITFIDKNRL